MIQIHPILPTFPIKKTNKVIRERKHTDDNSSSTSNNEDDEDSTNVRTEHHIDEIV